jgi:hypothetical protein
MDDDGYSLGQVWYSMATVEPLGDSPAYFLTLDHGSTLWPAATDIPWYTPKEKHRALVFYTILSDAFQGYDHAVKVLNIEDVLTKPIAEDKGEENDSFYGNDPVKILDMWVGDDYLNVEFRFDYGGSVKHFINLVKRDGVDTLNYFEFRHNAYQENTYASGKGIVSFDLSTLETDGEEIELTIHVKTFEGDKDYTIKYQPDKETPESSSLQRNLQEDFAEIK